jgi:hypothetical protein
LPSRSGRGSADSRLDPVRVFATAADECAMSVSRKTAATIRTDVITWHCFCWLAIQHARAVRGVGAPALQSTQGVPSGRGTHESAQEVRGEALGRNND